METLQLHLPGRLSSRPGTGIARHSGGICEPDSTTRWQIAAERASAEIYNQAGQAQFFAWFNRGTSLMRLQD